MQTELDFNRYIAIPYKSKGRDISGLDCYGLVRLVLDEQFGVKLPSFDDKYDNEKDIRVQEIIAQQKEGWIQLDKPEIGSVVLFKVLGHEQHVGIVISDSKFLHIREGKDSVVDSLNSTTWKKRIVGYFKYKEKTESDYNIITALPAAFSTRTITVPILIGSSISTLVKNVSEDYNVSPEILQELYVQVNGVPVPKEQWNTTFIKKDDIVTYRAIPKGGAVEDLVKVALFIAVAVYAPQIAGALSAGFTAAGTAGASVLGSMSAAWAAGATGGFLATAAVTVVGNALINRLSPVRPSVGAITGGIDPGTAERQLILTGGRNEANPYGAIPVVLGRVRMTPQLAAQNFLQFANNSADNYLNMLLYWGHGPLSFDNNSYKFGDVPITNFTDYTFITLDRSTNNGVVDPTTLSDFNAIYGTDVDQVVLNQELVCDGNPEQVVSPGPWFEASTTQPVNLITINFQLPEGLRRIRLQGDGAGNSEQASVGYEVQVSDDGITWFPQLTTTIANTSKDAYSFIAQIALPRRFVRIRRTTGDNPEDNPSFRYYHRLVVHSVAFFSNQRPAIDPPNSIIAKTALRIKASDQLNGSVEGFNAIVQSIAPIWNGSAWVNAPTSNPASLMIHVLTHPANPRRKTMQQIDLPSMQYFYNYCQTRGFEYNSIIATQRGLLDVLRDICAAGRASPALIDGKWTVTIDEPKPQITQMFTPHNSWGFEGTKNLPDIPHGLRVRYYDQDQGFQESEIIVYNIGYNQSNASLFESITLPGVTKKSLVIDHAKWQMAQAKLRPEVYSLNVDIEYLVANRGDRVKVMHDVPMWGLGSGRIKDRISDTVLRLDEELFLEVGKSYIIRFRSKTGSSVTRNIVPVSSTGYYNQITLTSSVTVEQADVLDLFMFGENQQEGQDLIVLSVEPASSMTARLTLVDYGVTSNYNIFTQYLTLTENTVFESQITLPGRLQVNAFGDKKPTITNFLSDESVMEIVSKGVFRYNINVAYVNAINLPTNTTTVEAQYDLSSNTGDLTVKSVQVPVSKGSVNLPDVQDGITYKIRLRYINNEGRVGQWTAWQNHTVVGKRNPPAAVTGLTVIPEFNTGRLRLSWNTNFEPDLKGYEVRTNTNFGNAIGLVFDGDSTTCQVNAPANVGQSVTYFIAAYDYFGNYSPSTSISWTYPAVANVGNIDYNFEDTALTAATVTLDWVQPVSTFAIDYYEVSYNGIVKQIKADNITLPADWLGNRVFTIRVVDINAKISTGTTLNVTKLAPNPPTNYRSQVIDNTMMLYWTLPARTTLPIDHVKLKKGATWASAIDIGEKKGEFTTVLELSAGNYTYWVATVDTDGNESTPISLTTQVNEPPDFIFNSQFNSTLSATRVNAAQELSSTSLILPVNTTETWEQHFLSRSWTTPQDQINAGFPIYVQPGVLNGSYQEVFDFGTVLASSQITVNTQGSIISGAITTAIRIEISLNNSTWSIVSENNLAFATNFRYVRVTFSVVGANNTAIYRLDSLTVRLDAKQKTDSGNNVVSASDTNGTLVNFGREFIDVTSITVSPQSTTPVYAVYDFQDASITGTYSVVSNIATIDCTGHGLIVGQRVRLIFTSGTATSAVYTVASVVNTNTFTVAITTANTSGNVSMYPQGMRVYLFNTAGTRINGTVSWSVRGY